MRIEFKQRVQFQKKAYGPGEVDLDVDQLSPHEKKFFHKMIEQGLALEPKSKPIEVISEAERSKRLAEKLLAEKRVPKGPNPDHNSLPQGVAPNADQSAEGEAQGDEAGEGDPSESSSEAEEPSKSDHDKRDKKKKR